MDGKSITGGSPTTPPSSPLPSQQEEAKAKALESTQPDSLFITIHNEHEIPANLSRILRRRAIKQLRENGVAEYPVFTQQSVSEPPPKQYQRLEEQARNLQQLVSKNFSLPSTSSESNEAVEFHHIDDAGVSIYAHPMTMSNTAVETMWRQSETHQVSHIIALQSFMPGYPYFPQNVGETLEFGVYNVTCNSRKPIEALCKIADELLAQGSDSAQVVSTLQNSHEKIMVNEVTVENKDTKKKWDVTINQLFVWEDGMGIDLAMTAPVLAIVPAGNCQIHCMKGVGRTGTLITLKQMQTAFESGDLTKENLVSFMIKTIRAARTQRGSNEYVQKWEQFRTLLEYGMKITAATQQEVKQQMNDIKR